MAKGKYAARRKGPGVSSKLITVLLSLVLVLTGVIGGTVAWLIAESKPVVNTFTYGDVNIALTETDTGLDTDLDANTNTYKMIPGQEIDKDPVVTVIKGSESMWLFVKLEASENFDDFITYDMADGWISLTGEEGVYYREVKADQVTDDDLEVHVIKEDKVTVPEDVTKEQLNALTEATYPKLTITAYAVQRDGIDSVADAWEKVTANP